MKEIEVVDPQEYSKKAVERLGALIEARPKDRAFHVFLSGGSTPKPVYRGLAQAGLDWSGVHLWWGDERYVPPDHPDSNYRLVKEHLLDFAAIPAVQIHPWPILSTPELSAETYQREFRGVFGGDDNTLDLQIMGMGDDGHTASLFPNSPALDDAENWCVANRVAGKENVRLTLTFPALRRSRRVVFLITGAGKASTLKEVWEEGRHPAAQVEGQESTLFLVDGPAAGELSDDK